MCNTVEGSSFSLHLCGPYGHRHVLDEYQARKQAGWADPETPPAELRKRISFLSTDATGNSLEDLGLVDRDGHPDITLAFPELASGESECTGCLC